MGTGRTAVVLFNLGGPDRPEAVRPFLFNLFSDPAIIRLPQPLRGAIAWLIARQRAPVAAEIYRKLGGGSPLLPNTKAQAEALEAELGEGFKTFIAMRYWHPRASETARCVAAWKPDRIVLLPLYPQFSTTTTASSLAEWRREAKAAGIAAPTVLRCCYPEEPGLIASLIARTRAALEALADWPAKPRILFSAHGLPERIAAAGDPYQHHVEQTVARVVRELGIPDLDHVICYQSRVGPLKWIGPATDEEIRRAGHDGVALVVVSASFVSEHSETLVELDIEYRHLAQASGVPRYVRAPTVDTLPGFIAGLARLVREAITGSAAWCLPGSAICPPDRTGCPLRKEAA
ncbi:MAG TPA: ferrochelatase [Stellaceae bacterium]|nr:ferrochelatase [Stellaceae bacterium]